MRWNFPHPRNWRRISAVNAIIAANVAVWILLLISGIFFGEGDPVREFLTLELTAWKYHLWWKFFTYMWVHADPLNMLVMGFIHILFNMSALWMFGRLVEVEFGKFQFLAVYVASGVAAAGAFFLEFYLRGSLSVPDQMLEQIGIVGASGAVMGVLAIFAVLRPNAKLLFFFIPYPIKAKWALIGFLMISFGLIFVPMVGFIGHSAHIGGALMGYLWVGIWRRFRPKPSGDAAFLFIDESSGAPVMEYVAIEEIRSIAEKYSTQGDAALTPRERSILLHFSQRAT